MNQNSMNTNRVQKNKEWFLLGVSVVCIVIGVVILIYGRWEGWIWLGMSLVPLIVFFVKNRRIANQSSEQNILKEQSEITEHAQESPKSPLRWLYGILAVYFTYLIGLFVLLFTVSLSDGTWILLGFLLMLLTFTYAGMLLKIGKQRLKGCQKLLDFAIWPGLLCFACAAIVRFLYEPAEINDGIRGLVTLMWVSPMLVFSLSGRAKTGT